MSGYSDEEISNGDRDGYEGGGSDGDDDDDDEDDANGKRKQRRRLGFGYGKRVVLHQFTKAKNQIRRIRGKRALLPSSSSSSSRNVSSRGKRIIHGDGARTGTGCRFCFLRPKVLETPDGSPTSDPNDPNFTQSMLKTLIEKNDFYSKECNPHVD